MLVFMTVVSLTIKSQLHFCPGSEFIGEAIKPAAPVSVKLNTPPSQAARMNNLFYIIVNATQLNLSYTL